MKRFLLLAVMAVASISASAQIETGSRMGMAMNGALSNYSEVNGGNLFCYDLDVFYEYNFLKYLYAGVSVNMGIRGSKIDSYRGYPVNGDLKSYNVALPIYIGGRAILSDKMSIFTQAGPYVSTAIKNATLKFLDGAEIKGEDADWGFTGKAGIEIGNIQIYGGYEYGKGYVWPDHSFNRSILFGIAYIL